MKLSLRDFLWLTIVAALRVAWWFDHRKLRLEMELIQVQVDNQKLADPAQREFEKFLRTLTPPKE